MNLSTNLNDKNKTKDIKSLSTSLSMPLGYNTISYDYSRSEFRGINQGVGGVMNLIGFSSRNNLNIDRVLWAGENMRLSAFFGIAAKSSSSYLNREKIATSQRKLTIGNIGFSWSNSFKNGVRIYLKPTYWSGLKLLNADRDSPNLHPAIARAQFDYVKFYGSFSKQIIIPKINIPVILSSEVDSQYSWHTLFGTEQFSVGGYNSVLGFRENFITGDAGYFIRNKIRFGAGSLLSWASENSVVLEKLFFIDKLAFEPFYDYGYVKNKFIDNQSEGRLAGVGFKTIFTSKYFNASLIYSKALSYSKLITSDVRENKMIYFEITGSCC